MASALPLVSPRVTVPVPEPPNALVLVVPLTVPDLIVKPPVKVLAPERVNCEVALFWITPVTLAPMTELIVTGPFAPLPAFVTVPVLLIAPVENVRLVPMAELLIIVRLLVPVTPPL